MNIDDLATLLPTLSRQDVRVMAHTVLDLRTPEHLVNISLINVLKAGLWEFMRALGFVTDAQARSILVRLDPALRKFTEELTSATSESLPVLLVTFAEQRWVGWSTQTDWYDMLLDESVAQLPEPAVLLVTCDVTSLHLRQRKWLRKLKKD